MKHIWTADDDTKIRELWDADKSVGEIAKEMEKTRGQIAGRVWKMKLFRTPKDAAAE